ncbi:MAG TPA: DUF6475 domain-containing protein [Syntrophales bacterium]|nr:DUF6475 domain-containing protein [Syntrophales bacterium]
MTNQRMFKEYMTALSEIHGKELSALLNSLYWKTLEPFTDAECERAFKDLIFSAKFFPKPAEFLEVLQGKREDLGARAWIKVIEAARRYGNWQSVEFDDPVIHSVFKFWGGWGVIREWKDKDLKWIQKEFERLYSIFLGENREHPKYLPGDHEIQNAANGYERTPEIVRIGSNSGEKKQITNEMRQE